MLDTTSAPIPDWEGLERDVILRIRMLRVVCANMDEPGETRERIWHDLILPNLRLLAAFCAAVEIDIEDVGDA
jgi:hypothetical protein